MHLWGLVYHYDTTKDVQLASPNMALDNHHIEPHSTINNRPAVAPFEVERKIPNNLVGEGPGPKYIHSKTV